MEKHYPIILTREETHTIVSIPDFNINTQGKDFNDAMEMARDAILTVGKDMIEDNESLPEPSDAGRLAEKNPDDVVISISVNFN